MQPQRPRSAKPHSRRKRPCTAPSKRSSISAAEEGHAATRSRAARHGEAMQPWWMAGNSNADEDDVDGEVAFDKKANEALGGIVRWESDEILPLQPFLGVVIREAPQAATCAVEIPQKKARSPKRSRPRPASACIPKQENVLSHQTRYAETTEPPLRFAPTHEERAPILQRRPHNHNGKKPEKVPATNQESDLPSTEDRVEQSRPGRPHEQSEGTIAFPFSAKLGKSFCKVREMRQNIALHSAVLAFKHQIEHPKAKLSHELKRDRMRTLEQQSLADRTRVLASYVTKDYGPESEQGQEPETSGSAHDTDRNSFAFGWDAISNPDHLRGVDHSAVIWDNVAKHLDLSVLLQEVYNAKPETLPSVSSTHKAFSLLKTITELVEDDLVASALTAVGQVLTSAAFSPRSTSGCCSKQTSEELDPAHAKTSFYFESQEKLVSENAEMRERLGVLEAKIRQQDYLIEELQKSSNRNAEQERRDEEAKRKNSSGPSRVTAAVEALQHTLARVAPHAGDRTDIVLELYRTGSVPVDELTIAGLFGLLEEDAVPDALRLVLQECISKESAVEAVCCTLQREDAVAVAQRAMENDPGVERIFCVQAPSLTRLISFWELHWGKFCDILWFSPELLRTIVVSRPEVAGKFLKVYCQWLAQDNGAKVMFERHRSVMEEILNQVVDFGPSFLEATLVRNRQTLRDILESKSAGEDLLETLADSSPHIVGTILDFSQSTLGDSLAQRADLLGQVTAQNAAWFLAFLRNNQEVVSRTLCTDVGLLPGLIASSPMLMDALVRNSTEELAFHVAGHAEAIVATLAQAPRETLEKDVFVAHPKLLLGDKARLERLGLRNLAAYHSSCVAQASQTDPVSSAQISGHGQARSLVEIVGKRKARADGWTLDELESTIAQVYQEKIDADAIDDRAGHAREPLSEVVYDHFLSKEDDVAATKRALAAFTVALRSMADTSTTVRWFGVLVGAIDAERYSTQAESFFISLVRALVPYEDVGECIDSSEGQTLLPFLQVLNAVMGIASMYWYEISDREALMDRLGELQQYEVANSDLLGELESNRLWAKYTEEDLQSARSGISLVHASTTDSSSSEAVEDASGVPKDEAREEEEGTGVEMEVAEDAQRGSLTMKSIVQTRIMSQSNQLASNIFSMMRGRRHSSARQLAAEEQAANPLGKKLTLCVSLHEVLDVVMRAWYAMEKSEYDTLCEIFKSGDANGDGILDMDEWELLVLVVDPHADPRTVRRMFKMTGEENEDGEHIITPSEFVQVMRAHKYTGPALAHLRSKILASRSGKGE